MSVAPRMEYIENLYEHYNGDIHHIMNNFDLDSDDFDFMLELKEYRSVIINN